MSYDVYLFKPNDGESPDEAFERLFNDEDDSDDDLPSAESEALKEKLAHALVESNPLLERFQFDYAGVAKALNTSEDEARKQWRHIELNGPENGNGIQIQIEDTKGSITLPYWHKGKEARKVFEEVWKYLRVFQTQAGYLAYDPQLGQVLDLSTDLAEVLEIYTGTIGAVESSIAGAGQKNVGRQSRPWWKFW